VPADEDEGAGGNVHYVVVEQDLDQSPEGPKDSFATKANPSLSLTHVDLNYAAIFVILCAFMFRS
jgi:hypothetical protein